MLANISMINYRKNVCNYIHTYMERLQTNANLITCICNLRISGTVYIFGPMLLAEKTGTNIYYFVLILTVIINVSANV